MMVANRILIMFHDVPTFIEWVSSSNPLDGVAADGGANLILRPVMFRVLHLFISAVGIPGNIMACLVILSSEKMRYRTGILYFI